MDVAALALNVDSSSVVKAANDLERFSTVSEKAAAAGKKISLDGASGSIAKLVASVQSIDSKLGAIVSAMSRLSAANDNVAASSKAASTALNTLSGSFRATSAPVTALGAATISTTINIEAMGRAAQQADAHVTAFRNQVATGGTIMQQADAHVAAYRQNLAQIPAAANDAAQGVAKSAGAIRANTGNIAAQFQDIGVTAAMGMNPLIIGLQQGTQLSAVFAQSGGTMREVLVGAFRQIASAQALATIGLVALVAVAIQLAVAFANSGSETEKFAKMLDNLKVSSDGVSDAQGILGRVFDLTTGKMKTQEAAAINLARAQLLLMKASAQNNISVASKDLSESSNLGFFGRAKAYFTDRSLIEGSARVEALTKSLKEGKLTVAQTMQGFEMLAERGQITNEMFVKGSLAAANYGNEIQNVKTAQQGLADLERGRLSDVFMNPNKPRKTPKGPKTAAEKLADLYQGVNADIATEKARGLAEANELTANEAAKLEKQTSILNAIQQKGIAITEAVRKKVSELAQAYADAKIAADVSKAINDANTNIAQQQAAIADETKLIGLYGDALARARREMEAQRALRASLPKGEILVAPNLTGSLSDDIEAGDRARRAEALRKSSEDAAYAMDRERAAIGLTGAAAIQYAYVAERLVEAKRQGIALSPAEVSAIEAAGDAYATQRHAIDEYRRNIEDARESVKGFFTDWIGGAMRGESAIKAFGNATMNVLNRLIEKLLDKALDGFLNSAFPSAAARTQKASLSTIAANPSIFAKGGTFGTAQRFAQGGAFTNSIVTSPTLFRFAKGSALGEMGEAGPEAIMPLKRGPNGALGVQASGGGRPSVQMGDVHLHQSFAGAVGIDSIQAMNQQSSREAITYIRREFANIAAEYDQNGVVAA